MKVIDFSIYHPFKQETLNADIKIILARNNFLLFGRCSGKCYVDKELRKLRGQCLTQIMIDEFRKGK